MQSADAGTSISSMHVRRMEYGILIACSILSRVYFREVAFALQSTSREEEKKKRKKKRKTNTLEAEKKIVTK